MRIGLQLKAAATISDGIAHIVRAEATGFASVWRGASGFDAVTQLALAGPHTTRIELGTGVISIWQRHPAALAQQALTAQAACGGRFVLGLGVSHRVTIEGQLGFDWKPIRRMREYLKVLRPLMAGETVTFAGEDFRLDRYRLGSASLASAPPVVLAAHGFQMLELAGRYADGTIIYLAGTHYLREQAIPAITASAREADRPSPRIIAGVPVWVTDRDVRAVRETAAPRTATYDDRPSFRSILDADGSARSIDVAIIGTESEVRAKLEEYADLGVTDFAAEIFADRDDEAARTVEVLASVARPLGATVS